MRRKKEIVLISTLLLSLATIVNIQSALTTNVRLAEPRLVPQFHTQLMRNITVSYPWRKLITQLVFVGKCNISGVILTETVWACLWTDLKLGDKDVAAFLTILTNPDCSVYSIEMSRCDEGVLALELCVEINGFYWYPFKDPSLEGGENIGYSYIMVYP